VRSDIAALAVACVLARRWEGFRSRPYLCPAGVPTIGYGFTHYADGRMVTLADPPMTRAQAQSLLEHMVRTRYMRDTIRLCPNIDSPERLGAITDFAFNLGSGNLRSSNLRKKILADDWEAVPAELRKWTKAGGRVLRGLVLRREAEIAYL
jgi:lysozyme